MADTGLWDKPTIVNNVETLACVPHILQKGAGLVQGPGPKPRPTAAPSSSAICGQVSRPGCYELPMGIPFREDPGRSGGGMSPGFRVQGLPAGRGVHQLHAPEVPATWPWISNP